MAGSALNETVSSQIDELRVIIMMIDARRVDEDFLVVTDDLAYGAPQRG